MTRRAMRRVGQPEADPGAQKARKQPQFPKSNVGQAEPARNRVALG
jgi:hypothetical protein